MKMDTRLLASSSKAVLMLSFTVAFLMNVEAATADIKADADTILNWAEQKLPDVLPSHQTTQSLSPWLYRAYSSTDIYTGINTQDNGVYYISGNALRKGEQPVFYKSVTALLGEITGPQPVPRTGCDLSKIPAGHTATQTGNVLKISTNGCIPEPDDIDYCPQQEMANGISVKTTKEVTVISDGVPEPVSQISCTKSVSPDTVTPVIELDVCYTDDSKPPVSSKAQGKIVTEQVEDCLKTDATTVVDLANDDFWVNNGEGFIKIKKLVFK